MVYKTTPPQWILQTKTNKKMQKPLQKSFQDYISKIKKRKTYSHKFSVPSKILLSSSKRKILRACKHPKTRSVAVEDVAATLADVDQFLFDNFKSLFLEDDDEDDKKKKIQENDRGLSSPGEVLLNCEFFANYEMIWYNGRNSLGVLCNISTKKLT